MVDEGVVPLWSGGCRNFGELLAFARLIKSQEDRAKVNSTSIQDGVVRDRIIKFLVDWAQGDREELDVPIPESLQWLADCLTKIQGGGEKLNDTSIPEGLVSECGHMIWVIIIKLLVDYMIRSQGDGEKELNMHNLLSQHFHLTTRSPDGNSGHHHRSRKQQKAFVNKLRKLLALARHKWYIFNHLIQIWLAVKIQGDREKELGDTSIPEGLVSEWGHISIQKAEGIVKYFSRNFIELRNGDSIELRKVDSIQVIYERIDDSIKLLNSVGVPFRGIDRDLTFVDAYSHQFREFLSGNQVTKKEQLLTTTEDVHASQDEDIILDSLQLLISSSLGEQLAEHEDRKRWSPVDSLTVFTDLQTKIGRMRSDMSEEAEIFQSPDKHVLKVERLSLLESLNNTPSSVEPQPMLKIEKMMEGPIEYLVEFAVNKIDIGGEFSWLTSDHQVIGDIHVQMKTAVIQPKSVISSCPESSVALRNIVEVLSKNGFNTEVLNGTVQVSIHPTKVREIVCLITNGEQTIFINKEGTIVDFAATVTESLMNGSYVEIFDEYDADDEDQATNKLPRTEHTTRSRVTLNYRWTAKYVPPSKPKAIPDRFHVVKRLTISLSVPRTEKTGYSASDSNFSDDGQKAAALRRRPLKRVRFFRLLRAGLAYSERQGAVDYDSFEDMKKENQTKAYVENLVL